MTTKTGTRPKQGDIVLIPIPFTNLTSHKRRPVIVISNEAYNTATADIVVVAMTSCPARGPYCMPITSADLESGHLNHPGTVRVDKVYTLSQDIMLKTFGRVKPEFLERIRRVLMDLTSASSVL